MDIPDKDQKFPFAHYDRMCFLKNIINNPNIIVGDYTYYDDFEDVNNFEKNVKYLFDFSKEKLIIGKFCMIASDVTFIMNGGNHYMGGISTYPFAVFGKDWAGAMDGKEYSIKGDTVIGNDVWIGYDATIMPGVKIGDGSIIATKSVVSRDVAPYSIVGGNPAKEIKKRFTDREIEQLLETAWWDWPIEKITTHVQSLTSNDVEAIVNQS